MKIKTTASVLLLAVMCPRGVLAAPIRSPQLFQSGNVTAGRKVLMASEPIRHEAGNIIVGRRETDNEGPAISEDDFSNFLLPGPVIVGPGVIPEVTEEDETESPQLQKRETADQSGQVENEVSQVEDHNQGQDGSRSHLSFLHRLLSRGDRPALYPLPPGKPDPFHPVKTLNPVWWFASPTVFGGPSGEGRMPLPDPYTLEKGTVLN